MGHPQSGDAMAAALLNDTAELVNDDRDTHGDAVENQQHIADAWTWYLRGQGLLDDGDAVMGDDVAALMTLVKLSRHAVGDRDMDHMRDVAGYAGIGGACMVDRGAAPADELARGAYESAHLGEREDTPPESSTMADRIDDDTDDGATADELYALVTDAVRAGAYGDAVGCLENADEAKRQLARLASERASAEAADTDDEPTDPGRVVDAHREIARGE